MQSGSGESIADVAQTVSANGKCRGEHTHYSQPASPTHRISLKVKTYPWSHCFSERHPPVAGMFAPASNHKLISLHAESTHEVSQKREGLICKPQPDQERFCGFCMALF